MPDRELNGGTVSDTVRLGKNGNLEELFKRELSSFEVLRGGVEGKNRRRHVSVYQRRGV